MRPGPLFCLTTDFGTDSPYVAEMKAVLLSAQPTARIVDVTHGIAARNIRHAEVVMRTLAFAFPLGAVHVVIVDPGVGSARRGLAVRARGMTFVGPDNGVLATPLADSTAEVVALDRSELFRAPVSPTFHGRDIFAPVAAELAAGSSLDDVGTRITDARGSSLPAPRRVGPALVGETLLADHFGNLTTNVPRRRLAADFRVSLAGKSVPVVRTYAEAAASSAVALVGSDGFVEIAVRDGSAAQLLGAADGLEVRAEPCIEDERPATGGSGSGLGVPGVGLR